VFEDEESHTTTTSSSRNTTGGESRVVAGGEGGGAGIMDRRMSREWDAAITPPSRFQKMQGSIWATPASRDGPVDRNRERHKGFKEKVKELAGKGFGSGRRGSE